MKSLPLLFGAAFALAACASGTRPTPTTPTPAATPTPPATIPTSPLIAAPKNWQLLDATADLVPGTSAAKAYTELLAGKQPKRTVLVAVIDGGIDTAHADLKANLWQNPKDTPGNHKDDDNNGYADDVYGWNFIGGTDGKDVWHDTFEVTRIHARCLSQPAGVGTPLVDSAATCKKVAGEFDKKKKEIQDNVSQMRNIKQALDRSIEILRTVLGRDSLTVERLRGFYSPRPEVMQARDIFISLAVQDATPAVVNEALKSYEAQAEYALNLSYNPRTIVGDNYADPSERRYGNPDVMGQDAKHGTHVAGIIGAVRNNNLGIDGIASAVKIMMVRTVPDGDERDKDVANAIRYAVDNGAQIINMSFGKAYSPFKSVVDDAVKYADSKGVLMVHAAGNEGEDLGKASNFPTPKYAGGGRPSSWIEVGASSWKGGESLAASFSNYGKNEVDLFAPGVEILSTVPGNQYEKDSGTSMAAPVVSGVAALLMSYYPSLSAADVKRILVSTAAKYPTQMVTRPGNPTEKVAFGELSASGGIVNAYNALKMAEQMTAVRP